MLIDSNKKVQKSIEETAAGDPRMRELLERTGNEYCKLAGNKTLAENMNTPQMKKETEKLLAHNGVSLTGAQKLMGETFGEDVDYQYRLQKEAQALKEIEKKYGKIDGSDAETRASSKEECEDLGFNTLHQLCAKPNSAWPEMRKLCMMNGKGRCQIGMNMEYEIGDMATDLKQQNIHGSTPFALAISAEAPEDLLIMMLEKGGPGVLRTKHFRQQYLPIHTALSLCNYSPEFYKRLVDGYPECVQMKTFLGKTPLQLFLQEKGVSKQRKREMIKILCGK